MVEDSKNAYHQFANGSQGAEADYNRKYMTKDNHNEVIICYNPTSSIVPYIVTDPLNASTFNYGGDVYTHSLLDVMPYWLYGNTPFENTCIWQRMFGNLPRRFINNLLK